MLVRMAILMVEMYDALRAANVPDENARRAAEAVAGYESRFASIERDLAVLKWMVGTNVGLTLAVLAKLLLR
jgi:hypothetical protein